MTRPSSLRQFGFVLIIAITGSFSTGCASLNSMQRSEYHAMKDAGVAVEEKSPILATALGVLPGGGSFYTHQWGLGVADFLLWPTSILWDPFAGHSGAEVINYDVSRSHLKQTKARELSELENQLEDNKITQAEFNGRRRTIESQFDFD